MFRRKPKSIAGKHVLITGGSSGIGLSMALAAAEMGANITIVARNEEKLKKARVEVEAKLTDRSKQKVRCVRADVTGDFPLLDTALKSATEELGPVYMLVNNAGTSIPRRFVEADLSESRYMMDVNYFGSLSVTKSLLPQMQTEGDGVIVFVASQAAFIGIYGLATYSGSKYAVRGFAEALAMEVRPHGIGVSVCCPPDTDTPGFEEEQKTKPEECKIISGSGTPIRPEIIARCVK
jgi:3-dehydrosphinganine reductase